VLNSVLGEGATEEKGENARMVRNPRHLDRRTSAGLTKLGFCAVGKERVERTEAVARYLGEVFFRFRIIPNYLAAGV
jgi:hypothetical protein